MESRTGGHGPAPGPEPLPKGKGKLVPGNVVAVVGVGVRVEPNAPVVVVDDVGRAALSMSS